MYEYREYSRKKSWLARRSKFQIYLLCMLTITVVFFCTVIIEYQKPDFAGYLMPVEYRSFLHDYSFNIVFFLISATWFPLTPVLYVSIRRYRAWKQQYRMQHLQLQGKYVTMKGEVVKSYGEKKVADYLYTNGIRYEYERPFYGYDEYGRYRLLAHPDFYIPDYGTVVEYFGMAGSSESYDNTARWKMERYRQNGIHGIAVFPRDLDNLNLSGSCNNTAN